MWLHATVSHVNVAIKAQIVCECQQNISASLTMAFASSQKTYACRKCEGQNKFYKMVESKRPTTCDEDEEGGYSWWRICLTCEGVLRVQEWEGWTQEQRGQHPTYCEMPTITRDKNLANKEESWVNRARHIAEAKRELTEEAKRDGVSLSGKQKKQAIWARADELAKAFLAALKHDNLMKVFSSAGDRMLNVTAKASEEYDAACSRCLQNPDDKELQLEVERLEDTLFQTRDYKTLIEKGDQQPEYLKALDFMDMIGPSLRVYNAVSYTHLTLPTNREV